MESSWCGNCSDGVAREKSDQFMEGRSNADGLVVDCEGRRDKTDVLQMLQWFLIDFWMQLKQIQLH